MRYFWLGPKNNPFSPRVLFLAYLGQRLIFYPTMSSERMASLTRQEKTHFLLNPILYTS
jgi:hypothetical protein